MNKIIFGFLISLTLVFTSFAFTNVAYAGIVPNCNTGELIKGEKVNGIVDAHFENPCDFAYVMLLINNFIKFLLFVIATPLAAVIICYAGFLMLTSGGNSEKLTKAKSIMKNIIFGYIIALAAWLIVHTIFTTIGFKGETYLKKDSSIK